jgi:hypothetical protein
MDVAIKSCHAYSPSRGMETARTIHLTVVVVFLFRSAVLSPAELFSPDSQMGMRRRSLVAIHFIHFIH